MLHCTVQSDLVELESAEDTLVDIGKVFEIPQEVTDWNAEKTLAALPAPAQAQEDQVVFSSIKVLVAKSGSASNVGRCQYSVCNKYTNCQII